MPVPVVSVGQMREWEQATWSAGRTEEEVIQRVGHLVNQRVRRMTRPGDLVVVLAGKGHNGDDARHACLNPEHREIYLINALDPERAREEFLAQLPLRPALVVDGLFGIGLSRPLEEKWQLLIRSVNEARVPVLSVDVPSGLNADSGEVKGSAICATVTLTLGAAKHGLLQEAVSEYVGRLEVEPEIGLVPCPIQSELQWVTGSEFAAYPPARPVNGHKGSFGHVLVVAGSVGYQGAAVMTARAASRAQPGLVSLYTMEGCYGPVASQLHNVMVHPWTGKLELPPKCSAVVAGPGLAGKVDHDLRQFVVGLWRESDLPVVLDASALDWVRGVSGRQDAVRVVTPHPGEVGKLLGRETGKVQADRMGAVRELAESLGCWVVLKGRHTLVGKETGAVLINSSGNAYLAQGGSGDVLAGYVGGLVAQGWLGEDMERVLSYAVWEHGATADRLSAVRKNWGIEELLNELGNGGGTGVEGVD